MIILGIETSCDETSAAVVENGSVVHSCVIASSRKDFESMGGVLPEIAARKQTESILPVIEESLKQAMIEPIDLDAIAVTQGPGLLGSLLVGTTTARVLAATWGKPLIPVHHTLGHLSSTWLIEERNSKIQIPKSNSSLSIVNYQLSIPSFPLLTLSVSGGHSDLWYRTAHTKGKRIGSTLDDAAGEAFDKGAVQLGLPYPGGPALSRLAQTGDPHAYDFPLPLRQDPGLNFSFSGLKTSLKYLLRDLHARGILPDQNLLPSIAASYEFAICRHIIDRLERSIQSYPEARELHVVGGVAANTKLRSMTEELGRKHSITVRFPETIRFCTDNGAMIAAAGYFLAEERPETVSRGFKTEATMDLQQLLSK